LSVAAHHAEWLSLVETSGPFLTMPVLLRVFPQGLDSRDAQQAARMREAYEDWLERGSRQPSVHHAWIRHVLHELLGYPLGWLAEGQAIPPGIQAVMANVGEVLRPDIILKHDDVQRKPILLVALYPPEQDLEKPITGKLWKATAGTRMMELLHAADLPLGLITNGEEWTLVSGPRGETTGFASWYADLWMQEPLTLRAFHSLLHLRRLVGVGESEALPALFIESTKDQQEVTDQLGYQVRQAVGVLVQAFDRVDVDSGRTLLSEVNEKQLYDSALTVMMRLVFLFSAEERGLLLLGDPLYDQNYAVSTLSALLREQADLHGEEVLERRHDAWCRLLSTFRAVHGGVEHEAMRLPAYGGTLFDPDRYPFLEGRVGNAPWRNSPASPLLINNRVVLHLLEALQVLRVKVPGGGPAETRRLSFRALDIEQIGHVYEGLLDHTAKRATEPVLGLAGSKDKEPEISLAVLEQIARKGTVALTEFLRDETGRGERSLTRLIDEPPDFDEHALLSASGQDERLASRVKPFAALLREDSFGQLVIVLPESVYVTASSDRRSTGTHYTPRSLTEPIVKHTLEPLVYFGPADGLPDTEWSLKNCRELLALKVCDLAMGSGAFLVSVCRYLAERLVESWENAEREHPGSFVVTPDGELSLGAATERLIPADSAERITVARRYIADRCLYGVDINPMAVEMAKLSLWLVTLQRDRPFTFLDHALRCGDSLLGVTSVTQIAHFSVRPTARQITFATASLSRQVGKASAIRRALEEVPSNDQAQITSKNQLHVEAQSATAQVKALADALIAFELRGLGGEGYEAERTVFAERAEEAMRQPQADFQAWVAEQLPGQWPFHWPLEFPEVFERAGFDAFVGNPPYLGGTKISTVQGAPYLTYLTAVNDGAGDRTDLVAYFVRRAFALVRDVGTLGFVTTNTIAETDTAKASLHHIIGHGGTLYACERERPWPGAAGLSVSVFHATKLAWSGPLMLDGHPVPRISSVLTGAEEMGEPHELSQTIVVGVGAKPNANGFLLGEDEARVLLVASPQNARVVRPYLAGDDVVSTPDCTAQRWAIYFGDIPLVEAEAYPEAMEIVRERVYPERRNATDRVKREKWWQFERHAKDVVSALAGLPRFFATSEVSKFLAIAAIPTGVLPSNLCVVFASSEWSVFAILQSTVHEAWARRPGMSKLETRPRYNPTLCFKTFPLPTLPEALSQIGQTYHARRLKIAHARVEGLTDVYNRFHDPSDKSADVSELRTLRVEMDRSVVAAYEWSDLDLGHAFHPTKGGTRFTVSEPSRRTLLERLLALNHLRYAEGTKTGFQTKRAPRVKMARSKSVSAGGPTLLD
jgi:hypothetical protein